MDAHRGEEIENGQSGPFQVCPSCHRWYRDSSRPWWDDHCGECTEAARERTRLRMEGNGTAEGVATQLPEPA